MHNVDDGLQVAGTTEPVNEENVTPTDGTHDDGKITLTQKELDEMIKSRLDREKRQRESALEKQRLELEKTQLIEQAKYKELAEQLQKEIDSYKKTAQENKKEALMSKAGYSDEQINRLKKFVTGDTDEELTLSLNELIADIPPNKTGYVDPSVKQPQSIKPQSKDNAEYMKELFARIKGKK